MGKLDFVRLSPEDGTWDKLETDWLSQCEQVGESFEEYATSSVDVIRNVAVQGDEAKWALALSNGEKVYAIALGICARQKGFDGKVLRIREVTVCPLLDYGVLNEDAYIDTLISLLDAAIKLSESGLCAEHIKMHLRSPSDRIFFRAVGATLDSKGVFQSTEAHGAWLSFTKHPGSLKEVDG